VLNADGLDPAETYDSLIDIICAFIAELIMAYGREHPNRLFLHAAGAMIGGKLWLFPGAGTTGKSFMSVQLARHGARLFSDDVVPVDLKTCTGYAMGIEPRLRLPLPDAMDDEPRRWTQEHLSLRDDGAGYVALGPQGADRLAPQGTACPVGGIVLIDRDADSPPSLEPLPRADVLKLMIVQNFGAKLPAATLVAGLARLVENLPCWRLRFAGGEAGIALLREKLGTLDADVPAPLANAAS
jgi:hypothetical protein